MCPKKDPIPSTSTTTEIDAFLSQVATTRPRDKRGRLLFALDATASREPTWDHASHIQAQMFEQTMALGGLEIQLAYYRGYGEFETSPWLHDTQTLLRHMTAATCLAGLTQIHKILQHTIHESRRQPINALVFIGDCMEEEVDQLGELAGQLGIIGTPAFMFQEGEDPVAEQSFRLIASLSKGAYCHFDSNSPQQLRDLLNAVAVYAAGGRQALASFKGDHPELIQQITRQIGHD